MAASASAVAGPREEFLKAEALLADGDDRRARALIDRLGDYVLTPYLELAWAERHVEDLPHDAIATLLARHADVPIAYRLRRAWLARLARERRDALIVRHHVEDDHEPSACLAADALHRLGRDDEAWPRVATLWRTGRSLPDECDPVLASWRAAGQLSAELAWERAALALRSGNPGLARHLRKMQPGTLATLLDDWLALRSDPSGLADFARAGNPADPRRQAVLLDAVERVARRDTARARELWHALSRIPLERPVLDALREQVGQALAREGSPDALEWLDRARSADALSWRALVALQQARWRQVADTVAAMPGDERDSERWRYWHGRALRELGEQTGTEHLRELARERSYYGFLAADDLGTGYTMQHRPLDAGDEAVERLANSPGARRAKEWLALGRDVDARREWELILRRADATDQRAAARLAHRWEWHAAAIRAAAAARAWDDLEIRFPLAYPGPVRSAAVRSDLPESRIYAVARQESAFMAAARSSAGALGLMQLMPDTARHVAQRASLAQPGTRMLMDPGANLRLGSLYLASLERRYDGHPVLASAAYNAGPGRVARWRPRASAVDADTWIEGVPFDETRSYLRAVLAYQVIYAHRLGGAPLRLRNLMPAITPASR